MNKLVLLTALILVPALTTAQLEGFIVYPGTYTISLGKYSDWNSRIADSKCGFYGLDCELDNDENRVVGDSTSSAGSASALRELTWQFGFDCLEKAARFSDIGQHVYPEVGAYGGPLHAFFEAEANRCWNHYDQIYENNQGQF